MAETEKRSVWTYESGNEIVEVDPRVTLSAETAQMFRQAGYNVTEYVPASSLEELEEGLRREIKRLRELAAEERDHSIRATSIARGNESINAAALIDENADRLEALLPDAKEEGSR